jgi:penicillin-binding protein-related factor A (putative recombinase)
MNVGKSFEQDFFARLPESVYKLRLPDPAASFSSPSSLRFSNKNPYDFLLYRYPHLFALELKSRIGAISFYVEDSPNRAVDIKKWQIEGLKEAASHPGVIAGFVLNFRDKATTYYLPIQSFLSFTGSTTKKSINENDVISLGAFKIPQTLKRTKYSFDVTSMLDFASQKGCE